MASLVKTAGYLGDFLEDTTVRMTWATHDDAGAAITRAVDGTISVYKDHGLTQSTAGITDTEDADGVTGVHFCTIDTSADAFYATGSDYDVVLSGATIDGQAVNDVLGSFSIENRLPKVSGQDVWMGQLARSTATKIHVGPFLSVATGAPLTTLTLNEITCRFIDADDNVTSITLTAAAGDNDMVHVQNGIWTLELTAANLAAAGIFSISFRDDDVFRPFTVRGTVMGGGYEQVDVMAINGSTALPELTDAADIPATPTPANLLMLLYMWLRNNTQSVTTDGGGERRILNDAGTEILDATVTDDGTTTNQGKLGAP